MAEPQFNPPPMPNFGGPREQPDERGVRQAQGLADVGQGIASLAQSAAQIAQALQGSDDPVKGAAVTAEVARAKYDFEMRLDEYKNSLKSRGDYQNFLGEYDENVIKYEEEIRPSIKNPESHRVWADWIGARTADAREDILEIQSDRMVAGAYTDGLLALDFAAGKGDFEVVDRLMDEMIQFGLIESPEKAVEMRKKYLSTARVNQGLEVAREITIGYDENPETMTRQGYLAAVQTLREESDLSSDELTRVMTLLERELATYDNAVKEALKEESDQNRQALLEDFEGAKTEDILKMRFENPNEHKEFVRAAQARDAEVAAAITQREANAAIADLDSKEIERTLVNSDVELAYSQGFIDIDQRDSYLEDIAANEKEIKAEAEGFEDRIWTLSQRAVTREGQARESDVREMAALIMTDEQEAERVFNAEPAGVTGDIFWNEDEFPNMPNERRNWHKARWNRRIEDRAEAEKKKKEELQSAFKVSNPAIKAWAERATRLVDPDRRQELYLNILSKMGRGLSILDVRYFADELEKDMDADTRDTVKFIDESFRSMEEAFGMQGDVVGMLNLNLWKSHIFEEFNEEVKAERLKPSEYTDWSRRILQRPAEYFAAEMANPSFDWKDIPELPDMNIFGAPKRNKIESRMVGMSQAAPAFAAAKAAELDRADRQAFAEKAMLTYITGGLDIVSEKEVPVPGADGKEVMATQYEAGDGTHWIRDGNRWMMWDPQNADAGWTRMYP